MQSSTSSWLTEAASCCPLHFFFFLFKWNSIDCAIRTLKGSSLSAGPFARRILKTASESIFATVNLHSLSSGSWELLGVNSRKVPLRPTINNGGSLQRRAARRPNLNTTSAFWLSDENKLEKWISASRANLQFTMNRAWWGTFQGGFSTQMYPMSTSCSLHLRDIFQCTEGDISSYCSSFSLPVGSNVPEFVFSGIGLPWLSQHPSRGNAVTSRSRCVFPRQ